MLICLPKKGTLTSKKRNILTWTCVGRFKGYNSVTHYDCETLAICAAPAKKVLERNIFLACMKHDDLQLIAFLDKLTI